MKIWSFKVRYSKIEKFCDFGEELHRYGTFNVGEKKLWNDVYEGYEEGVWLYFSYRKLLIDAIIGISKSHFWLWIKFWKPIIY